MRTQAIQLAATTFVIILGLCCCTEQNRDSHAQNQAGSPEKNRQLNLVDVPVSHALLMAAKATDTAIKWIDRPGKTKTKRLADCFKMSIITEPGATDQDIWELLERTLEHRFSFQKRETTVTVTAMLLAHMRAPPECEVAGKKGSSGRHKEWISTSSDYHTATFGSHLIRVSWADVVRRIGPNEYEIPRELLDQPRTWLKQVRHRPKKIDGEMQGWLISRLKEGAVLSAVGFKIKDVVTRIGDHQQIAVSSALTAYQQAKKSNSITVHIDRMGEIHRLKFHFVDREKQKKKKRRQGE